MISLQSLLPSHSWRLLREEVFSLFFRMFLTVTGKKSLENLNWFPNVVGSLVNKLFLPTYSHFCHSKYRTIERNKGTGRKVGSLLELFSVGCEGHVRPSVSFFFFSRPRESSRPRLLNGYRLDRLSTGLLV